MTAHAKIENRHRVLNSHNIIYNNGCEQHYLRLNINSRKICGLPPQRYNSDLTSYIHIKFIAISMFRGEGIIAAAQLCTVHNIYIYMGTYRAYSEILLKFSISIIISNVEILLGWWKLIRFCFCFFFYIYLHHILDSPRSLYEKPLNIDWALLRGY